MSHEMTRREMLARGAALGGALMGSNLHPILAAGAPPRMPNRPKAPPATPVGIQRCDSYEPAVLRKALDAALNGVADLRKLVAGKTVTIKLNLTGGIIPFGKLTLGQTYQSPAEMVGALCAALADAGARRIRLVESFYSRDPVERVLVKSGWDVDALLAAGGGKVTFENTRNRGTHKSYARLKVPWGGCLFGAFDVHPAYEQTDVFVSLAKMKDHASAGVTLAAKNLIGIMPLSLYGDAAPSEDGLKARGLLHNAGKTVPAGVPGEVAFTPPDEAAQVWQYRVPRATADVVGARPIDLSVIEAVETVSGGEGPWIKGLKHVQPHLLIVGTNPVCTDAVAAAVMGYNPAADAYEYPFQGENHLALLARLGVGANDPAKIQVLGLPFDQARFPFSSPKGPGRKTAKA